MSNSPLMASENLSVESALAANDGNTTKPGE